MINCILSLFFVYLFKSNFMADQLLQLQAAEKKAALLFLAIQDRKFLKAGISEEELNKLIFDLAEEMFGITKYWHKRIVRAGKNTLMPYRENPPNLLLESDDIVFFDFGPVFEEWEADFGRTYVIGDCKRKIKLKNDIESAWWDGKRFYDLNKNDLTGADLYFFTKNLAEKYGWEFGNKHCGHIIGEFPHEKIQGESSLNYIHPNNHQLLSANDQHGNERFWIYEVHFIDRRHEIGGFFEQLIS